MRTMPIAASAMLLMACDIRSVGAISSTTDVGGRAVEEVEADLIGVVAPVAQRIKTQEAVTPVEHLDLQGAPVDDPADTIVPSNGAITIESVQ